MKNYLLVFILFFSSCFNLTKQKELQSPKIIISLEKTACFGRCPVFKIIIYDNGEALYNPQNSTNFQLHPSEEEFLVFKILELAGVTIAKPDLVNIANQEQAEIKTQQKS